MNNAQERQAAPQQRTYTSESQAAREAKEVEGMLILAKRFPRDEVAATNKILQSCKRLSVAASACYEYQRGGSAITGPSIRLAEELSRCWGNMQHGVKEVETRNGSSVIETYAWDFESNTRVSKVFSVEHKRVTKNGSYKLEDPRDIYEMVANNGARRLRACILQVIPSDVVDAAVEECDRTVMSTLDMSDSGIEKLVKAFENFNVSPKQLEEFICRSLHSITPVLMLRLKKVYNSLKDGMSAPGQWFPGAPDVKARQQQNTATGVSGLKERIGDVENK